MHDSRQTLPALLAMAMLLLAAPSQALTARDTQEINSYVLTDAGLARYAKAIKALGPITKNMSNDCDDEDDSGEKTLDQLVTKVNSVAAARTALQSAGMTPREYLLFTMSVIQTGLASWGLSQPGGKLPPGVSMANVDFYRKNEAAIAKLGETIQSDDCNADEAEDDNDQ